MGDRAFAEAEGEKLGVTDAVVLPSSQLSELRVPHTSYSDDW
jgi:hypothetical protein